MGFAIMKHFETLFSTLRKTYFLMFEMPQWANNDNGLKTPIKVKQKIKKLPIFHNHCNISKIIYTAQKNSCKFSKNWMFITKIIIIMMMILLTFIRTPNNWCWVFKTRLWIDWSGSDNSSGMSLFKKSSNNPFNNWKVDNFLLQDDVDFKYYELYIESL